MGEPWRVLLVDDDEDDYLITRDLFREIAGPYQLTWEREYDAALHEIARGRYDALLFDYHLGARTGIELLQEAKAVGCRAPILILTGAGDRNIDVEAMQAGAADYLDKSLLTVALLERSLRYAIDRRRHEEQLERSNDLVRKLKATELELSAAVRTRDDFLSVASHELKTPLTPLRLQLDQLRRLLQNLPGVPASVPDLLDSAKRQAVRLSGLVETLLDVSRIVEGRLELRRERIDLAEVARDVCNRFQLQAEASSTRILFSAQGSAVGEWDRLRLEQVLSNLLSNALKYGRGNPVDVTVHASNGGVAITVRDRGIGIDAADVERIFGRFERAVSSRHYGGLGLGLYIANEIVQAHGGKIRVESSPGRGSIFTVVVPRLSCGAGGVQSEDAAAASR